MDAPGPSRTNDGTQQRDAPEHVIDLMLGVMRPYPGPFPDVAYARAARAEAKIYADRIWAEAWAAGAAWGLARNSEPIRVEVTAERLDQLRADAGRPSITLGPDARWETA
jgi:hypothetical protein